MTTRPANENDVALQRRLAETWIASQRSPNTRAAYRTDLKTFDEWCAGRGSTALRADLETLTAFATAREAAGDSPSTLRRRWSALSSFFDFAIEQHATPTNPLDGVPRPRTSTGNPSTTRRLSPQAVAGYRARAAELDPRLDALVALLVAGGLKLGEALALDVDDVEGRPPKTNLTIPRHGALTRVRLDAESARAVLRCIGARHQGPLFLSGATSHREPRRLTRFGADHLIRQLSRDDAHRVTTNELRRYHITHGNQTDSDLANVRDRAGLANVRSVRRYFIPTEHRLDEGDPRA